MQILKEAWSCSLARGGRALLRLQKFWKNTVARSCCLARGHHAASLVFGTGFAGLCCFWCFDILAFLDVFGYDVGHLKALALIPIGVYVGGK